MKYIILLSALLVTVVTSSNAQTINGKPLSEIDVEYVQIVGTSKLLSTQVHIDLDFGQRNKLFSTSDTKIMDEDGKVLVLNSMIDALNFMTDNGYEYVDSYAITMGNQNVYHFLLKQAKVD